MSMIYMKTQVELRFSEYYHKWVIQLDEYARQLITLLVTSDNLSPDDTAQVALVARLTAHHKDYYTVKWAAARQDLLAFYSAEWLTPLEKAYSWMTGWKLSTAFLLMRRSVTGVTEEQEERMERLRVKMRAEEEKVEREMERHQMSLAGRRMVELARRGGHEGMVEAALKALLAGLEKVMKAADCMRLKTLKGVLDELNPKQRVQFLAATSSFQLQLRQCGKKREDRQRTCF